MRRSIASSTKAGGPQADRLNRWLTLAAQPGWLLGLIVKVRQSAALTRAD